MAGEEIRATRLVGIIRNGSALYHLITGMVMAGGFLLGFLPIYTGFLNRLGAYDTNFGQIDGRLKRAEADIIAIQSDVRAGNNDTRQRLDAIIAQLAATHELVTKFEAKGAK